ncbi:MAG: STAS domain-containing protein [Actinobacteria bacterium]|nr:STAS domain-containing protein [Actinomycetota bacterium]
MSIVVGGASSGTTLRIVVTGDLDLAGAPQLRSDVRNLLRDNNPTVVEIDLGGVEVLDDIGVGVLLGIRRLVGSLNVELHIEPKSEPVVHSLDQYAVSDLFP